MTRVKLASKLEVFATTTAKTSDLDCRIIPRIYALSRVTTSLPPLFFQNFTVMIIIISREWKILLQIEVSPPAFRHSKINLVPCFRLRRNLIGRTSRKIYFSLQLCNLFSRNPTLPPASAQRKSLLSKDFCVYTRVEDNK